jgi:hypothetical protein
MHRVTGVTTASVPLPTWAVDLVALPDDSVVVTTVEEVQRLDPAEGTLWTTPAPFEDSMLHGSPSHLFLSPSYGDGPLQYIAIDVETGASAAPVMLSSADTRGRIAGILATGDGLFVAGHGDGVLTPDGESWTSDETDAFVAHLER